MIARIQPRPLRGTLQAIPSKSEAHRALICAAIADAPCDLRIRGTSEDIEATIRCLRAFGVRIEETEGGLHIVPPARFADACTADCGESGSTLRFLLPLAGALGIRVRFVMHGRLPQRPLAPLDRELIRGGCTITRPRADVVEIGGRLRSGAYVLPGNVSSQYVTGMLLALSLTEGESTLTVEGALESADYVFMTLRAMKLFGALPETIPGGWRITGTRFVSPGSLEIGGDWSNGAFWLCADALPGCSVTVEGLDPASAHGDRRIVGELRALREADGCRTVDAAHIPDLIPALAAAACASGKTVRVAHAERLRIKESDRLHSICSTITALGGDARETADGLVIVGSALRGGKADAAGDHRIAMLAAILSAICAEPVELSGAEAVNKSYPTFWEDFARLGGCAELL